MKNSMKKIAAVLSAAILGALPMANSLTANAAASPADDEVKYIFGDVYGTSNGFDGKIDIRDAQTVLQWASNNTNLTPDLKKRADVDGNGRVEKADAMMILEYYTNETLCQNEILGDANGDGEIKIADVICINRYNAGTLTSHIDLIRADVNKDGKVNNFDSKLLRKYLDENTDVFNVRYGDTNSDGVLTNADCQKIAAFIGGDSRVRFTDIEKRRADVNYDGKIDGKDLTTMIKRTAANIGYFCD